MTTNYKIASLIENSYEYWLDGPLTWRMNEIIFKRISSQKWAVSEVVKRLRKYSYIDADKLVEDFKLSLQECARVNPSLFKDAYKIIVDVEDFLNCLEYEEE